MYNLLRLVIPQYLKVATVRDRFNKWGYKNLYIYIYIYIYIYMYIYLYLYIDNLARLFVVTN